MKREYALEQIQDFRNIINNGLWAEHDRIAARIEEGEQKLQSETNETIKELCENCMEKENKHFNVTLELLRKFDALTNEDFAEIMEILDR